VQWWFHLAGADSATRVIHEMELDIGELHDPLLITLRNDFEQIRGTVIRAGMEKTLRSLKQMAEASS
jgi:hypothetical protein